MNKILTSIFLLFATAVSGQTVNKKIVVNLSLSLGKASGTPEMYYQNAAFPKLFANTKSVAGGNLGLIYLFGKNIGAGFTYSFNVPMHWSFEDYYDFNSSKIRINSLSPCIHFQTDKKISRKVVLFAETGPMFTDIRVKLSRPVFDVEDNSGKPLAVVTSSDQSVIGFHLSTGCSYPVNNSISISVSGSYDYCKTKSVVYPDTSLSLFSVRAGIVCKLLKDKRYYL